LNKKKINEINEIGKKYKPQGRIVGIVESPNRNKEQMCTLIENA
jgi:hypothetical protein